MKKFSKVLALALAVAMMLGMTAFAGATKLVINDNFSDFSNLDGFTANAMASNVALGDTNPTSLEAIVTRNEADKGTLKYNRIYRTNGNQLGAGNGYMATTGFGEISGFGYLLDTPFDLTTAGTDKALITQIDYELLAVNAGQLVVDWADIFALGNVSSNDTVGRVGLRSILRGYGGYGGFNTDYFTANPDRVMFGGPSDSAMANGGVQVTYHGLLGQSEPNKTGDKFHLTYVFRNGNQTQPYNHDTTTNNPMIVAAVNRRYDYGVAAKWNPYLGIDKVYGIYFGSSGYVQGKYTNFLAYEVSMKAEDFTLDSTNAVAEVLPNGNVEYVFSMPLSENPHGSSVHDSLYNISEYYRIFKGNDEENPLVYGVDYTFELSERVVGNEVKGVLTVKPLKKWDLGTTYTLSMSSVTSVTRLPMSMPFDMVTNEEGEEVKVSKPLRVTFSTVAAPATTFVASEGLTEGAAIADYAGKTVYVKATTTNSSAVDFDGKIVIGIYDEDGNLVKYASASKAVAGNSTATFGAAFKLAAGQTIRAEFK